MTEVETDEIIINYYSSSYGPTIRLMVRSLASLTYIKNLFRSLAMEKSEVELTALKGIRIIGMEALIFKRSLHDSLLLKSLFAISQGTENSFIWINSSLGWQECADLIDGMIENGNPGHQYLTKEDVDDALVEISYQE